MFSSDIFFGFPGNRLSRLCHKFIITCFGGGEVNNLGTLKARRMNKRIKTSFFRSTQDNKNTRASSRFLLSFVYLEKLRFSYPLIHSGGGWEIRTPAPDHSRLTI